ncbi:ABC transporter ATP-binding protein [Aliarcobacter thereius]|uniref:ABC transporter ATP-binding protein n=3 Tax=Arcobacteraceae TaxID=2808963 RepID=A0A1C7WQJ0_9BACT|nr:ABC transporter ATP-binding protein [Aliarcobacter thereius]OCL85567.1 putative ABC transporter ATP-binding protein [Aliarcobacter thereius]OCL95017.1 putative ABC transporter ATP-binding protein [Aliarcobacter thereius LMG 24486]OCM00465.1 putative ABC transporter ATP-binding protein [Aliarcobacter thereius]QBF15112.1 iron siderophore ABC transporter, ATP-binding protein [Aliarcobacter thereius LMG 24486]TLS92930.1 ABC transporter ATP-binding protein [Aliarcobacter thereius]
MKLIEAKNISFSYKNNQVLDDINFELNQGDILSLLGKNGSGKTTLLKILLGIFKSKGEVKILDKSIKEYSNKELAKLISYVPQTHQIPFDYTIFDVVLMGRLPHIGLFSNYSSKDRDIAIKALEKVGILHLKEKIYSQVSGGERQLAFIARALTQSAKIIFMDEPVTGLDYGNQLKLLNFLKTLSKEGYTFIKTTHYPEHALYASNKVMMLEKGKVLDFGDIEEKLTQENIKILYNIDVEIISKKNGYKYCIPIL